MSVFQQHKGRLWLGGSQNFGGGGAPLRDPSGKTMEALYGCWRRLREEKLSELFLWEGYEAQEVSRIMLIQFLGPTSLLRDPVGAVFPSVGLTELGSIQRFIDLRLDAAPIVSLYGGVQVHESAKFIKESGTLEWRRRHRLKNAPITLVITRMIEVDSHGHRLMKCSFDAQNEITLERREATSWYIHLNEEKIPKRPPGYFPMWTCDEDHSISDSERPLAFSLSPALIGRFMAEAAFAAVPPPIYVQQLLECQRFDAHGEALRENLDPACDPPSWSLCADALHFDPRPSQLRSLWYDVIQICEAEGADISYATRLGADTSLLLKKAMPFRYKYIPLSSLQQSGSEPPSDAAMAVLRDFVVLQGNGSSTSDSGSGWQYARDFAVGVDEWRAEKEMFDYVVGEPLVRRRIWMRLLVAQSDFFRANDFLNHSYNGYKHRNRGTIKSGVLDFMTESWAVRLWTKGNMTLVDDELIIEPAGVSSRGGSSRIPIKSATIRKLAQGTSDYKREKLDTRCEIQIITYGTKKNYFLRCKDEEERSNWICALGHQIVLLGSGGKGCYDECEVLQPGPLMFGEMFVEIDVKLDDKSEDVLEKIAHEAQQVVSRTYLPRSSWPLETLVAFVKGSSDESRIKESLGTLWTLSLVQFNRARMCQDSLGLLEALVLIVNERDDDEVRTMALGSIANLCLDKANFDRLGSEQLGLLEALVTVVRESIHDETRVNALAALSNLCLDEANFDRLGADQLGILEALATVVRESKHDETRVKALTALSNLSVDDVCSVRMCQESLDLLAAITLVIKGSNHEDSVLKSLAVLSNLSIDQANKTRLCNESLGLLEALVEFIKRSRHEGCVTKALAALLNLSRDQANKTRMCQESLGLLDALIAAAETSKEDDTRTKALAALSNLAPSRASKLASSEAQKSWQLRNFLLFDEYLECRHCNEDMLEHHVKSPWKIQLVEYSYHESKNDPLQFVLESAERSFKIRCVNVDTKVEWREAFRRVLRARSYVALQSTFCDDDGGSGIFTYSEDLVLAVKNNHKEENISTGKLKPTVLQAERDAKAKDEKLRGVVEQGEVPSATANEAVRLLKEKEDAKKLSARLYQFCLQVGIIKTLPRSPPLAMTQNVIVAMNKVGLKSSKLFDGGMLD